MRERPAGMAWKRRRTQLPASDQPLPIVRSMAATNSRPTPASRTSSRSWLATSWRPLREEE